MDIFVPASSRNHAGCSNVSQHFLLPKSLRKLYYLCCFLGKLVYCEITESENIREDLKNYSTKLPRVSYLYKVYCDIFLFESLCC